MKVYQTRFTTPLPAHLAGKPADCMAIVMQAMQWGMNPYAVAQKTHLVTGLKPGTITRARKESWMLGREYLHISPDGNPKPSSECIYNREAVDQWIEAQKKNQPGAKTT
ncbi:hypothetical protein D9U37_20365 [Salmonella enterica]|nr:hypothetical protein [Salmonella enterica]